MFYGIIRVIKQAEVFFFYRAESSQWCIYTISESTPKYGTTGQRSARRIRVDVYHQAAVITKEMDRDGADGAVQVGYQAMSIKWWAPGIYQ